MIDWRVELVEQAGSTNSEVADRARAGEAAGLVIATDDQVAGRGRLDRQWIAPKGATLAFSVLLRPDVPAGRWPWLPLATGLAVARGVRRSSGLSGIALKWPNDVLHLGDHDLDDAVGHKLCGILLERVDTPRGPAAVLGIGINVAMTEEQLPVPTATSLAIAGVTVTHDKLLGAILTELSDVLRMWEHAADDLRREYAGECDTIGRVVDVSLPDGRTVTGRVAGVDSDGRLDLETETGQVCVGAGDVVHVRPGVSTRPSGDTP